jgi:glyoxylase-like metal-dependent hydrolase (beta-lactamase superfamily II)
MEYLFIKQKNAVSLSLKGKHVKKKLHIIIASVIGLLLITIGLYVFTLASNFKSMKPVESGLIYDSLWAIKNKFVNVYIIKMSDSSFIAIDAGFEPGQLKKEMARLGIDPALVKSIFLTHTDYDHVACIGVFKNASVYIYKGESVMADGSVKKGPFMNNKLSVKYSCIDAGQEMKIDGCSIEAIPLKGHTRGHTGYLVHKKYLFTGDAIKIVDGIAEVFIPIFNMDTHELKQSINILKKYPGVTAVFTGHFGYSTTPGLLFSKLE